jgi:hypothetical protein
MHRRKFVTGTVASLLSVPVLGIANLPGTKKGPIKSTISKKIDIPVVDSYDVIVCGGGPAGSTAAINAARHGARVLLVENNGCLGGIWTSGLLSYILDQKNKSGFLRELFGWLQAENGGYEYGFTHNSFLADPEKIKLILERICIESGVQVLYHTRLTDTVVDGRNLTHIITDSKSGKQAYSANVFIDTTGDGDLAAFSGCSFDVGHPDNSRTQPFSMIALLAGFDKEAIKPFVNNQEAKLVAHEHRLRAEMARIGITPSYHMPLLSLINDDLCSMMANHEYGFNPLKASEISKATIQARAEIHHIINSLKASGGIWKNIKVVATAEQIGIREGRRIHGIYTITKEDLINGNRQPDAVCTVTFPVDVHSLRKEDGTGYTSTGVKSKPYDIPLRSLISKDIDNLMMAGRCISGDFFAHASYRVSGNAVLMGEAAGKVAAISALNNTIPEKFKNENLKG